ncbi:MAG TPA: NAD(P)/FAD-dependent oxidoreductase [Calditrichaeota bacterium]|nr:NAD(P)/FAD-dependent oxidoreductase [Calditrichota bacterium]
MPLSSTPLTINAQTDYDVIVIGSGAGGLSAALPLAQAGLKVLVCEQHEVPGGWTHSFALQGYRFSPGVHYIGDLHSGGFLRNVYEGLGVSDDLEFCELNPDGFEHMLIGQERFDFPKGKSNLVTRLQDRFPNEVKGIAAYMDTVSAMMENVNSMMQIKSLGDALKAISNGAGLIRWGTRSGKDLIDRFVSDPLLKGILSGQSGDHGLPPSLVSSFVHAGITYHYFNGGYYPRGGGGAIPHAFVRALKKAGGELRLKTPVARILLEKNKAVGVKLADGSILTTKHIISNADPEVTFGRLIGREHLSNRLRRKLDRVKYSVSALSLFFAVDMDLRAAGLDSGNYWIYDHADVDGLYRLGLTDYVLKEEKPSAMFLTVTTLKDPSKMRKNHHTCEAFTFVGYDAFRKWAHEKSGERSQNYQSLKDKIANNMLKALDKRFPGIRDSVVFKNLGTPLTNEYYINATRGSLYGIAQSRRQVGPGAFPIRSEIEGLYLCGASTLSHGVSGVTVTGLTAAKSILQCRMSNMLAQKGRPLQIHPAEDLVYWQKLGAHKTEK